METSNLNQKFKVSFYCHSFFDAVTTSPSKLFWYPNVTSEFCNNVINEFELILFWKFLPSEKASLVNPLECLKSTLRNFPQGISPLLYFWTVVSMTAFPLENKGSKTEKQERKLSLQMPTLEKGRRWKVGERDWSPGSCGGKWRKQKPLILWSEAQSRWARSVPEFPWQPREGWRLGGRETSGVFKFSFWLRLWRGTSTTPVAPAVLVHSVGLWAAAICTVSMLSEVELISVFLVSDGRNGVSPRDKFNGGIARVQFNNFCQGRKILRLL